MSKFSYYGFLLLIVGGILYTVERIVFYIFYYLYVSRIPEKPYLWSNVFVLLFLVIGLILIFIDLINRKKGKNNASI